MLRITPRIFHTRQLNRSDVVKPPSGDGQRLNGFFQAPGCETCVASLNVGLTSSSWWLISLQQEIFLSREGKWSHSKCEPLSVHRCTARMERLGYFYTTSTHEQDHSWGGISSNLVNRNTLSSRRLYV